MAELKGRKIEAMHRLYGEADGICGQCSHLLRSVWDRQYYKCELYGDSRSESTDWRIGWKACGMFNRESVDDVPVIRRLECERRHEEQIEGQITLEDLL